MILRKRLFALLLASAAGISCATSNEHVKTESRKSDGKRLEEIADEYHTGNRLMASSPDSAIMFYQKVLKIDPNHLLSLYHMGEAYFILGDYAKAEETHKRAIGINPKNPESWRHLALTYDNSHKYEDATKCWREIIRLCTSKGYEVEDILGNIGSTADGYKMGTYLFLAQSLMRAGQLDESLKAANEGLEKGHFIPLLYIRAEVYERMGNYQKAIGDYKRLLELDSTMAEGIKGNIRHLEGLMK